MKINSVICNKCRSDMKDDAIMHTMDYGSWMSLFKALIDYRKGDYDLCTNCMREMIKLVKAAL